MGLARLRGLEAGGESHLGWEQERWFTSWEEQVTTATAASVTCNCLWQFGLVSCHVPGMAGGSPEQPEPQKTHRIVCLLGEGRQL